MTTSCGNRLLGGVMQTATEHCELCQGGYSERPTTNLPSPGTDRRLVGRGAGGEGAGGAGGANVPPLLMSTDSEALMREGVAAAQAAFAGFLAEMEWSAEDIHKTFCHQVGRAHHRLLFESLRLAPQLDFATFAYLGNTGSVALPITAAIGIENGHLQKNDRVALLGIGSGINVIMLGVDWQRSLVAKPPLVAGPHTQSAGVLGGR